MQFMNASLAFIPNNKNVTFLMGNRCKMMMMMMIAKLLTCRVLFKKYNGPYHLLLTSYIHTFVDVLYKKYHHHLLHFILTSSSPSFFSFLLFRVCKAPKNASDFKNRLAAIHSQRSDHAYRIESDWIRSDGLTYFVGTGIDFKYKQLPVMYILYEIPL